MLVSLDAIKDLRKSSSGLTTLSLSSHIIYFVGEKPMAHGQHLILQGSQWPPFCSFRLAHLTDGETKVQNGLKSSQVLAQIQLPRPCADWELWALTGQVWQTQEDKRSGLGLLGRWLEAKVVSNALSLGSTKQNINCLMVEEWGRLFSK